MSENFEGNFLTSEQGGHGAHTMSKIMKIQKAQMMMQKSENGSSVRKYKSNHKNDKLSNEIDNLQSIHDNMRKNQVDNDHF
jgi:hypothetical protein